MTREQRLPEESIATIVLEHAHTICLQFEAAWRNAEAPRIEDYLCTVDPHETIPILRELMLTEIELRRTSGSRPSIDEYRIRFPEHGDLLSEVFASVAVSPLPSIEEFIQRLDEARIVSEQVVTTICDRLTAEGRVADAGTAAERLVAEGTLSQYQVDVVLQGRPYTLVLGDYALLDQIGEGGMGIVYKGLHRRMNRLVAIKTISPLLKGRQELVNRFYREIEAVAMMRHPNVVTAYDASEHEGTHYLVMEYIDGEDLSRVIRSRGSMPIPVAAEVIRQAAQALQYAHEQGIVHRDIKPSNLMIERTGTVKVLDFGLSRVRHLAGQGELTDCGQVIGTIDYMAPEQAADTRMADIRADIYSLGCTMFFLLTGRPPFRSRREQNAIETLLAHASEPVPSIHTFRPDVPLALVKILERMLAKKPENRPSGPFAVVQMMEQFAIDANLAEFIESASHPPGISTAGNVDIDRRPSETTHCNLGSPGSTKSSPGKNSKSIAVALAISLVVVVSLFIRSTREEGGAESTRIADTARVEQGTVAGTSLRELKLTVNANQQVNAVRTALEVANPYLWKEFTGFHGDSLVATFKDDKVIGVTVADWNLVDSSPLAALRDLESIDLFDTAAVDLTPLSGMPLRHLSAPITAWNDRAVTILGSLDQLETVNGLALDEFLNRRTAVETLSNALRDATLSEQLARVAEMLIEFNPEFNGDLKHTVSNGRIASLELNANHLTDVSPVRAIDGLSSLVLRSDKESGGRVVGRFADLSPLKDLPLANVQFNLSLVSDLSPLRGSSLRVLACRNTLVSDLAVLKGMPLERLQFTCTQVTDLSPLEGMPLVFLDCTLSKVTELSPLTGMPLNELCCVLTPVSDFSPIEGMQLSRAWLGFRLYYPPDAAIVDSLGSLTMINTTAHLDSFISVELFKEQVAARLAAVERLAQAVAAMPVEERTSAVLTELRRLNPESDIKLTTVIVEQQIREAKLECDLNTSDISPLRAFPSLRKLQLTGQTFAVRDLSPLGVLPLEELRHGYSDVIQHNSPILHGIESLRSIEGMPVSKVLR